MKELFSLITAELPTPIAKHCEDSLGFGTAMVLTAPITLLVYHRIYIMTMLMVLGLVCAIYSLYCKARIIKEGYEIHQFRVYNYTFLSPSLKTPTGMLMRPIDDNLFEKYHLAVNKECGLPELGSVIIVYVPSSVKPEIFGDRHYYPQVLGYEVMEEHIAECVF